MNKIITFLIRRKLGLKKYECFRFENQKSKDVYSFCPDVLLKFTKICGENKYTPSGVSLNWLLDYDCNVIRIQCPCNDGPCPYSNSRYQDAETIQNER